MKIGDYINQNFDHVYVRNLKNANQRLEHFQENANLINLKYEIFTGISGNIFVPQDYPRPQYLTGNNLSLISVILDAMRKNYESIVICDDDSTFYNYEVYENLHKEFLPADWDIINLGEMKYHPNKQNQLDFQNIKYCPAQIEGSQAVAYNKKAYFTILNHLFDFEKTGSTGDGLYDRLMAQDRIKGYIIKPNFCYQERARIRQSVFE
jgi:hypothetical protein